MRRVVFHSSVLALLLVLACARPARADSSWSLNFGLSLGDYYPAREYRYYEVYEPVAYCYDPYYDPVILEPAYVCYVPPPRYRYYYCPAPVVRRRVAYYETYPVYRVAPIERVVYYDSGPSIYNTISFNYTWYDADWNRRDYYHHDGRHDRPDRHDRHDDWDHRRDPWHDRDRDWDRGRDHDRDWDRDDHGRSRDRNRGGYDRYDKDRRDNDRRDNDRYDNQRRDNDRRRDDDKRIERSVTGGSALGFSNATRAGANRGDGDSRRVRIDERSVRSDGRKPVVRQSSRGIDQRSIGESSRGRRDQLLRNQRNEPLAGASRKPAQRSIDGAERARRNDLIRGEVEKRAREQRGGVDARRDFLGNTVSSSGRGSGRDFFSRDSNISDPAYRSISEGGVDRRRSSDSERSSVRSSTPDRSRDSWGGGSVDRVSSGQREDRVRSSDSGGGADRREVRGGDRGDSNRGRRSDSVERPAPRQREDRGSIDRGSSERSSSRESVDMRRSSGGSVDRGSVDRGSRGGESRGRDGGGSDRRSGGDSRGGGIDRRR